MIEPSFYDQLTAHWPAVCIAAAWLARELRVIYHGAFDLAEYVMAHGGVKNFIKKLWSGGAQ